MSRDGARRVGAGPVSEVLPGLLEPPVGGWLTLVAHPGRPWSDVREALAAARSAGATFEPACAGSSPSRDSSDSAPKAPTVPTAYAST